MAGKASERWTQLLIDWLRLASRRDKVTIMSKAHQDLSLFFTSIFLVFLSIFKGSHFIHTGRQYKAEYLIVVSKYSQLLVILMTWENGQFTNNLILQCFTCLAFLFSSCVSDSHLGFLFGKTL